MEGILLVDKPKGWTSHDVVAKVRSTLRKELGHKVKVGHTGTLDPMATGLLILLIGKATKQQDKYMKQDKTYKAEITLGATSDTDDAEGNIRQQATGNRQQPPKLEIQEALSDFKGKIEQVPPAYSAIKVGGKRSYKEARAGRKVELEPRTVIIHDIELISYEHPVIKLKTHVSSGTYIRSLARDIGDKLGTGAYLSGLVRTSIGKYSKQNSTQVEGLDINHIKKSIIPVRSS